jgi:hypothetical protein
MHSRGLALLWLVLGFLIWNAFFDLYIIDGTQHYLREQAEFRLGLGPEPSMVEQMAAARQRGLTRATAWASIVVAAGWATIVMGRKER